MIEFLKNLSEKSFWPLIGIYGIYLIYKIYSYSYGLKYVVNKEIYDTWFTEKMVMVGMIVCASLIFKLWGKIRIASFILALPVFFTIMTTLIIFAVWLFLAVAFILFGKS